MLLAVSTLLLVLGSSIVAALSPVILKHVVDILSHDGAYGLIDASAYLILGYALSQWLARILREFQGMFLGRTDQRLNRRLSDDFFQHLIALPLSFHLDRRTGGLSQILANGLLGYRIVLQHLINSILPLVIEFITIGAVLVLLGHPFFLGIIGMSTLSFVAAFWMGAVRVRTPARDAATAHIDAGAVFTDSVMNIETIKYFGGEPRISQRFSAALKKTENCWGQLYLRRMENGVLVASIFGVSLGLSVYVAAQAVHAGSMTIGEFVLVNSYILQLTRPVEMMGFALRDIAQGLVFIEKMAALLDVKTELDPAGWRQETPFECDDLVFENVSLAYGADRFVLRDLNLVVRSGKTVAIVGRSGSGKSSLMRLLMRLLEPTKGRIRVGRMPLSELSLWSLRDAIAVVPQDTILFNDSIAYNIALGRRQSNREEVIRAARIAGIHDFIAGLPDGYDTKVGERGLKLSGGERQRVAIARATIRDPKIFIFDEATSSLDAKTERAVLESLITISEKKTAIVITHRLSTVVHADEIVVLDEGIIVERGVHDVLLGQNGLYAALWHAQQDGWHHSHDGCERFASQAAST